MIRPENFWHAIARQKRYPADNRWRELLDNRWRELFYVGVSFFHTPIILQAFNTLPSFSPGSVSQFFSNSFLCSVSHAGYSTRFCLKVSTSIKTDNPHSLRTYQIRPELSHLRLRVSENSNDILDLSAAISA